MSPHEGTSPETDIIKVEHPVPQDCIDAAFRLATEFGSAHESIWRSINYMDGLLPHILNGGQLYFERTVTPAIVFPLPQKPEMSYYRFSPPSGIVQEADTPLVDLRYKSNREIESRLDRLATFSGLTRGQALTQAVLIAEEILTHENKGEELVLLDPEKHKFTLRFSRISLSRGEKMRKSFNALKSKLHNRF